MHHSNHLATGFLNACIIITHHEIVLEVESLEVTVIYQNWLPGSPQKKLSFRLQLPYSYRIERVAVQQGKAVSILP